MNEPSRALRRMRESRGLSVRDVEAASDRIAAERANPHYALSRGRLSEIETKSVVPSAYRLSTLSAVYRVEYSKLAALYGIDTGMSARGVPLEEIRATRVVEIPPQAGQIPRGLGAAIDPRNTVILGPLVEQWKILPASCLPQCGGEKYTYAWVGSEDLTLFPLLLPGSFVQVDENRNTVVKSDWASEYRRPIYLVETRAGATCCWCELNGKNVILLPHPLSPVRPRVLLYPREAEVVGQVVGIAMRLSDGKRAPASAAKAEAEPSLRFSAKR
jgi:transcriptional regulator with XRE-family HTH domain